MKPMKLQRSFEARGDQNLAGSFAGLVQTQWQAGQQKAQKKWIKKKILGIPVRTQPGEPSSCRLSRDGFVPKKGR